MLSINDKATKFCTSFLVVHAVLRLPLSVLLVFCEPQVGPRWEVGTAPRSELLFELLLVREQDTTDHDQDKWLECLDMARVPETVTLGEAWFAVHGTQHLDVWTPGD